jgi:hypothetical protein
VRDVPSQAADVALLDVLLVEDEEDDDPEEPEDDEEPADEDEPLPLDTLLSELPDLAAGLLLVDEPRLSVR